MAILNYVKREIVAKIVFYGPGLSGKTANIQKIHESMDPANVGELTSLATESDRTLFFDFVPIQLGSIAGLNTRFQLFTVPGQVFYNNTRRKVLEDADGVVFVADSQPEQLENNVESLKNLEENWTFYGKKMGDVPFVLQFNKQDLPGVMTEEELNKILNKWNAPSIRASCYEGFGVMETLAKVSTMVLAHLREQMTKKTGGGPPQGIKRTYSKEGISDDQVVKNMLEDIAAVGGVAEMQAATAAEAKAAAAPAARPAVAPAPAAARPAPAKPPVPAAVRPAAPPPKQPTPAPRLAPTAPLSAEDLLSDLDGPAATVAPPAARPREVVPRPAPPKPAAPVASPGSTKVLTNSGIAPAPVAPASEPVATPSMSRLKPAVAAPASPTDRPSTPAPAANLRGPAAAAAPARAPAKTAEELLESMEDRSGPGAMIQESAGSFGGSGAGALWEDDGPTSASAEAMKKPAGGLKSVPSAASAKSGVFGLDELMDAEERGEVLNKTSVGSGKINLSPSMPAAELGAESFSAVENTPLPASTVIAPAPAPSSGRATAALMLGIFNTLLLSALAAFNVAVFMGWIRP